MHRGELSEERKITILRRRGNTTRNHLRLDIFLEGEATDPARPFPCSDGNHRNNLYEKKKETGQIGCYRKPTERKKNSLHKFSTRQPASYQERFSI